MMEEEPPLTSPDESRKRNPPDRCPRPLYSQDSAQEEHSTPQGDGLMVVKVEDGEEEDVRGEERGAEEEISPQISTDGSRKRCPRPLYSQDSAQEEQSTSQHDHIDGMAKNLMHIKAEVTEEAEKADARGEERGAEEEISPQISPESGDTKEMQTNVKAEEEEKGNVKTEEEDLRLENEEPEDVGETERSVKIEEKAKRCMTSNVDNIPPKISCDSGDTRGSLGNVKDEEKEERLGKLKEEDLYLVISTDGQRSCNKMVKLPEVSPDCDIHDDITSDSSEEEHKHGATRGGGTLLGDELSTDKAELLVEQRIPSAGKPYSCSKCGKCFARKYHHLRHQNIHTGDKPFSCSQCGKCFSQRGSLRIHEMRHMGRNMYTCSKCGKSFVDKEYLERHEREHTAKKTYPCSECGKSFTEKCLLLKHQESHTCVKAFLCSKCGKCFPQRSYLVSHEKIHTEENPHACPQCGKFFSHKSRLTRHLKSHTGEKPFLCSLCGRSFIDSLQLANHTKIHTEENPFSCPQCGDSFRQKGNLLTHQRTHLAEKCGE